MPEKQFGPLQTLLMTVGFSGLCGWLSYLLKVQEGKPFKWGELFLHGAVSAAAGLVCFELLAYAEFPERLCSALSGVAGWGGTRFFKLLWLFGSRKTGLDEHGALDDQKERTK